MITSIIVGHKADRTEAIKAAKGDLRNEFKSLFDKDHGFDSIELITSNQGRIKRKRFGTDAPAVEAAPEVAAEPEATEAPSFEAPAPKAKAKK